MQTNITTPKWCTGFFLFFETLLMKSYVEQNIFRVYSIAQRLFIGVHLIMEFSGQDEKARVLAL